jgi:hypothetical protein
MGTIYTFHSEADITDPISDTDRFLIYDTSAGTTKSASGLDIKEYAAGGVGVVSTTATTLSVTMTQHGGRVIRIATTAPIVVTLPAASGTGATYRFFMAVAATGTESTIKVANTTDVMKGVIWAATTTSDNAEAFIAAAASDSIEMNGTTKGGVVGDTYELTDIIAGVWLVKGFTAPTGSETTPFDATVS